MQDPDRQAAQGRLARVTVHPSVMQRLRSGTDGYAPIALPPQFSVWNSGDAAHEMVNLVGDLDAVWNDVWRRRGAYFASLLLTLALFAGAALPVSACQGLGCGLSALIEALGEYLPELLQPVVRGWAAHPGWLCAWVLVLWAVQRWSAALRRAIDVRMRSLWSASLAADGAQAQPHAQPRRDDAFISRLRKARFYQRALQLLKWRIVPAAFAAVILFSAGMLGFVLVTAIG
jgi:hypothetical protein